MGFLLTKTILKEFLQCPKYAWWHVNDKKKYAYIQSELYGDMNMAGIGQEVEDLYISQYPSYTRINDPFDYTTTRESLDRGDAVIYQPAFFVDGLYTRCDVLLKNTSGTYDLVEIKSKNTVRAKSHEAPLLEDLLYDLSFQKYVLDKALGALFSGNVFLVHMNKEYIKNGDVDVGELLIQEDCTREILDTSIISSLSSKLMHDLSLDASSFDALYPYAGENPLLAFAEKISIDSIFAIKSRYRIKPLIVDRYMQGKNTVHDLTEDDIDSVLTYNGPGKKIAVYIRRMQENIPVVEEKSIKNVLSGLQFPLCFYDYETVSTPVPLFDGYHPWQQIVVQYSMHIVYSDGTVEHRQSIIDPGSNDNISVIDAFVRDIDHDYGTHIVWNKAFENGRNSDIALLFPHYASIFSRINNTTFDLMDIFKNDLYFHPLFAGSASIKKVLPVLTDISYAGLPIGDGITAADILQKLIIGAVPEDQISTQLDNLVRYCSLDTWAMVAIRQKLTDI